MKYLSIWIVFTIEKIKIDEDKMRVEILILSILTSCAGSAKSPAQYKYRTIEQGMTTGQISSILKSDPIYKAGVLEKFDHKIEIWLYSTTYFNWCGNDITAKQFYFYFCDGRFAEKSYSKNWKIEAENLLYEILIKENAILPKR